MRSDGVNVGGIKKYREQYIYPIFLKLLEPIFNEHKQWLKTQEIDYGYYPMFVNKNGMAETTQNYRDKFKRLVNNHLLPALVDSDDFELKVYAEMLMTRELSPHSLRHWFTVQLVLNNEPIHSISSWRGDDDLNSALYYTNNKSQLINLYRMTTSELLQDINDFGDKYVKKL